MWCDGISNGAPGKLLDTADGARAFLPDPLPHEGLELPADLHRLVARARDRLGELRGIGRLSRNPSLFIPVFQTREAAASSRIEGTKTTNEEALAHQAAPVETAHDADANEVANYRKALRQGVGELRQGRRVNTSLLLALHQSLMDGVRGQRTQGRLREVQNFVGSSEGIDQARFVPPPPFHVRECMDGLQRYLDTPTPDDPIVRAALVHYQFETIHPFEDGNGRIGRLLIALQTIQEQLQQEPLLYVSSQLEARRPQYYDRLRAVSLRGDFVGWVEFFVRAMIQSAEETIDKVTRIVETIHGFEDKLKSCTTPGPARLLKFLGESPFLIVKDAKAYLGISGGATADVFAVLQGAGILARAKFKVRKQGRGRPPDLYYCPDIVALLI